MPGLLSLAPMSYSPQVAAGNASAKGILDQLQAAESGYSANHFGGQTPDQFNSYVNSLPGQITGPFAFAARGEGTKSIAPVPNLNPSKQPYFDPNYPNESMLAIKNYTARPEQNLRGLDYSGVGPEHEMNMSPLDAQAADFQRLTGLAGLPQILANPNAEPSQGSLNPEFAFYDPKGGGSLASPGYLYDPTQPPKLNRMPWLTSQTSPTSPTA